jgi:hypothetical protein
LPFDDDERPANKQLALHNLLYDLES